MLCGSLVYKIKLMKLLCIFISVFTFFISTQGQAQTKPQTRNSRSFTDLIYLPPPWQFELSLAGGYGQSGIDFKSPNLPAFSTTKSTWLIGVNATLGLTDWLAVGVTETYANSTTEQDNAANSEDNGFSDPKLNVHVRALDQYSNGLADLLLKLSYSPEVIEKDNSSTSGNMGNGRDILKGGAALYRKFNARWEGLLGVTYTLDGEASAKNGNLTSKSQAPATLEFDSSIQYRFTESFYGRLGFQYATALDDSKTTNPDMTVSKTNATDSFLGLAGAKFVLISKTNYLDVSASLQKTMDTKYTSNLVQYDISPKLAWVLTAIYTHEF